MRYDTERGAGKALTAQFSESLAERGKCKAIYLQRWHRIPQRGEHRYDEYCATVNRRPLQWAFAYMAVKRFGRALIYLRKAYEEGDIIVAWLHILPLFDPLRSHPRFQELVDRVRSENRPTSGDHSLGIFG